MSVCQGQTFLKVLIFILEQSRAEFLFILRPYGNPNGVANISLRSKSKFSSLNIHDPIAITIGLKILLNLDLYGNPNGVANIRDPTAITIGAEFLFILRLYGNPNGVANIHDPTAITIGG